MKRLLTVAVGLGLVLLALLILLTGCAADDRAAAQRANSEASLETARGQAYAERVRADAAAQAERAAIREAQQNAALERAILALPYVLIAVAVVLVLVLVVLLAVRAMVGGGGNDPALLGYLQRLELAQAEERRQLWRAIAALDRRLLAEGDREGVIIYNDRRQ